MLHTDHTVAAVLAVFRDRGHEEYHGEPVSQLEHAVQSAQLAQQTLPDDPEFILAAFLHDFGHLCDARGGDMDGYGAWNHETIGAETLKKLGFSDTVTSLVANHVRTKRYLVSADPDYYDGLSEASKITLEKQGGPLSEEERRVFEQDPLFDLHLALRRLDEQAKEAGKPLPDMGWLEQLMRQHLS